MWPHLGKIERVIRSLVGIQFRHDLYLNLPLRELTLINGCEQIFLRGFTCTADHALSFVIGPVLVTLQGLEVEFDPITLTSIVPERVGMRAITIDVTHISRQSAIRHQNRYLMQAFRRKRPEIPHGGCRTQIGLWMTLLGVDEIGELQRITHKENRRVVTNQIPVAFFGVELQCKAAHIALGIGCTLLTGNG